MSKERFLLWMLAGIFTYQAATFAYGVHKCGTLGTIEAYAKVCPDLGERYDNTFNQMITATLALLTGSAIAKKED